VHGGKPVVVLPGLTPTSALMVPGAPAHVTVEPARIP
jgi:hypothetical protein